MAVLFSVSWRQNFRQTFDHSLQKSELNHVRMTKFYHKQFLPNDFSVLLKENSQLPWSKTNFSKECFHWSCCLCLQRSNLGHRGWNPISPQNVSTWHCTAIICPSSPSCASTSAVSEPSAISTAWLMKWRAATHSGSLKCRCVCVFVSLVCVYCVCSSYFCVWFVCVCLSALGVCMFGWMGWGGYLHYRFKGVRWEGRGEREYRGNSKGLTCITITGWSCEEGRGGKYRCANLAAFIPSVSWVSFMTLAPSGSPNEGIPSNRIQRQLCTAAFSQEPWHHEK